MSSGSSGEEVCLTVKCLQEEDIEQPLSNQREDHQERCFTAGCDNDDDYSSDDEREQDFISSVVSRERRSRVHWGDRPRRKNEGEGVGRGEAERRRCQQKQRAEKEDTKRRDESFETNREESREEAKVEEVTDQLISCSLHTASPAPTSPMTESTHTSETGSPQGRAPAELSADSRPSLDIIQVGVSKRGVTRLRGLLKNQAPEAKHNPIGHSLLESLRATLNEWLTDESLKFLHGADRTLDSPSTYLKEEEEEEDEELDEDDLEDDVTEDSGGAERRATAAVPDYEALKRETQQMVLKVREFYKGTWIMPEEPQKVNGNEVSDCGER